jgi:hypothetical protein
VAHDVNVNATPAIDGLISAILAWDVNKSVKKDDKMKLVELAMLARVELDVERAHATNHRSGTATSAAAPDTDAVALFTEQAMAAIQAQLRTLPLPLPVQPPLLRRDLSTQAAPRARPPQPPNELLVTISMAKADRKSPNRQRSPTELKAQIESAMDKTQAPGLCDSKVHSVRKLANGNILVQANSEEQAKLLLLHGQAWTVKRCT